MNNSNINNSTFGSRVGHGIDQVSSVASKGYTSIKDKIKHVLEERRKAREGKEKKEIQKLSQMVYDNIKGEIETEIPEEVIKKIALDVHRDITDIVDRRIQTRTKEIVELTVERLRTHKK